MVMPPKICPECREEYVHAASVCSECDVALVLEGELPEESAAEALPPASEMVCVRASSVGWAMSLSEQLTQAGIPHRIQAATADAEEGAARRPGQNLPYGVFVLAEHEEAAMRIDRAHTGRQIPDMPEDSGQSQISTDECPACGDPITSSAAECPGCGLALLPPQ